MESRKNIVSMACIVMIAMAGVTNIVNASPPSNPVGVAGQVKYNGELVGDGVPVTIEIIKDGTQINTTTNGGNYAVGITGVNDGDTIRVTVTYMGKTVENTTVIDANLLTNWCNISIYSSNSNGIPVIVLPDNYTAYEGDKVIFDASHCYDTDGEIVSYTWNFFGDGNPYTVNEEIFNKTWMKEIYCIVYLTITDNDGNTNRTMREINILNKPPVAVIQSNNTAYVGDTVCFDGSASYDAGNDTIEYYWDVNGDGIYDSSYSLSEKIYLTYNQAGTYNVSLKVVDQEGAEDITTKSITILDEGDNNTTVNQIPVVNMTINGSKTADGCYIKGTNISLKSNSYDPDGEIVNTTWNFGGFVKYGENVSYELNTLGNKTIRLTVEDNNGSKNYTVREICVVANNTEEDNNTLALNFTSSNIEFSVKNTENEEIVYSGSSANSREILIENLKSGNYIIYCSDGKHTWTENVVVDGYTHHTISEPPSNNKTPVEMYITVVGLIISTAIFGVRRRENE